MEIWKKLQSHNVFQIGFPTSTIFPDLFSLSIYFSRAENRFWVLFLNLENLPCGAHVLVTKLLRVTLWLASVGSTVTVHMDIKEC
jgi:hypothetical protein